MTQVPHTPRDPGDDILVPSADNYAGIYGHIYELWKATQPKPRHRQKNTERERCIFDPIPAKGTMKQEIPEAVYKAMKR